MNEKTNDLTESCINKFHELANLFREKNKQYGDKDQLANFRNGAMLQAMIAGNICMRQLKAIAQSMLPMFSVPGKQLMMKKLLKALAILPYIASSCSTWWRAISRLQKKQRRKTMNNKEDSINKVDELVNRAQLAINDWQCSGDVDCLEKAAAYLRAAMMEAEGKNE